jgi:predicted phosphoadenosine phosphosulfate sulfurtransferase
VPEKLARTNRAPSYKMIAMAILRNDFVLKSLGFDGKASEYYRQIKAEQARKESAQMSPR